jgi:hypothetical protein
MVIPDVRTVGVSDDMSFELLMYMIFSGSPSQATLDEFSCIHPIPAEVVVCLAQVREAVQRRAIGVAFPHIRVNDDTERAGALRVRLELDDENLLAWVACALGKGGFPHQKHDGHLTFGVSAATVTQLYLLP